MFKSYLSLNFFLSFSLPVTSEHVLRWRHGGDKSSAGFTSIHTVSYSRPDYEISTLNPEREEGLSQKALHGDVLQGVAAHAAGAL